ncbi:MAG TPA: adenylate/guanylate cyclase domain-containing protein, partial [Acidimicrobiia bacterium]|nr:adenylate/guanylate cyclase domain-containing protein [Acidimicrobiia bacterium]
MGAQDRFCSNCGTALRGEGSSERSTGDLSWPRDDLSRYLPEELLAKMRSAREGQSMEGERRTVTMLFADIQGSTSSAEKLDPEDWADIMNGAFERLIAPIYRYEGTLAQLRGDSTLAFFGAPIAHEDDPVRALRAGLAMVDAMTMYGVEVEARWGVPAHVRVGVNTGLVVVGAMGSDLRVEYSALGDAINVAARMEQTADPDTVRVTGHTLSLTRGMFDAEELGLVEVKGKSQPVTAYRLIRYVGAHRAGTETPIVGRSAELERLDDLGRRLAAGTGSIVSVIGEAGVGKSRLLAEMTRQTADKMEVAHRFDEAGDVNWLKGSSRSYDSGNPFSTIADMLGHWWFADPSTPRFEGVETAVAAEGIEDQDAAAFLAYIGGVPLSESASGFIGALETEVLNTKANAAAHAYIAAVANRRPTVLVFEDLHWADDLSLALAEDFMELTEQVPLGLVITMRPYRDEPTWRIHEVAERDHHYRYVNVTLEPLNMTESLALLDSLLSNQDLSSSAKQRILDRSEGNPLYIEQMVRSMKELDPGSESVDAGAVPSSLNGLLTARLDRLDEQERYLVQMASVLGSEFDRTLLTALVDDHTVEAQITDLLKRGIFAEVPAKPETSLAFRHALIQQVAYETILKRTRREIHQRVADYLIVTEGAPQNIARHLLSAEQPATAYPYLIEAGQRATRSMALADAIELLTTAIDHTPEDADAELIVRAHEGLGEAYALIPDLSQAAVSYQRLYEFGEHTERPQAQVAALNRLAYATASLGADLDGADAYLTDARRIAEENQDDIGLAEYHMNACFIASMRGDLGTAVAHDEETVRLGEETGVASIRLSGLIKRATNYITLL